MRQLQRRSGLDNPRAMLLLCYQHDEVPFRLPRGSQSSPSPIRDAMSRARRAGLEIWQVRPGHRAPGSVHQHVHHC
jgi:hypothetical protein